MASEQAGPGQPESAAMERATITACPDGPLLVRGDFELLTSTGEPIPRRRRTVALCRCGFSAIKPYCDGSHKVAGFRTRSLEEPSDPVVGIAS